MPSLLRRQLAGVMLFILVVAALAPGVSHALVLVQGHLAPWSVVCATPGETADTPARDAMHLLQHCAWCSLHGDQQAPPATAGLLQHPALREPVPALRLHAPRLLPVWAAAQARGPPAAA